MMPTQSHLQYEDFNDPEFDELVEHAMEEFHAPGMAVLVVKGNQLWAKGFGYSDLEKRVKVTPETLFFTGSTTKSFTAAMTAHLVESHEYPSISWQTPMSQLIGDDFVLDQNSANGQWATNHVTLEDCLSHRTGLPRHELAWVSGTKTNREIVRSLRHVPVRRELRAGFEYSNNPYTAVSYAVEKILDQAFKKLLDEHIFTPLDMRHTTFDISDAKKVAKEHSIDIATSYLWNTESADYETVPLDDIPPSSGAGGIISNVLDYSRWVIHLMKPTKNNTALSENAVKAMRTPKMLSDPKEPFVGPRAYGLGLRSGVYRGREVLEHGGAICGFMTNMYLVPPTAAEIEKDGPDNTWAVVTMTNSFNVAHDVVAFHLLDKCLGTPIEERYNKAAAAREAQRKAQEKFAPDKIKQRLFGTDSIASHIGPTLPIPEFAGMYDHPAYNKLQISTKPFRTTSNIQAMGDHLLYMAPPTSAGAYMALTATLHHVSGDWWWAHVMYGPSSWISDEALKVQFVVGANGKIQGMRYQAEPNMPDSLAFFKKMD